MWGQEVPRLVIHEEHASEHQIIVHRHAGARLSQPAVNLLILFLQSDLRTAWSPFGERE